MDDWREGADLGENGVGVVEGLLEGLEELVGLEAPLHKIIMVVEGNKCLLLIGICIIVFGQ